MMIRTLRCALLAAGVAVPGFVDAQETRREHDAHVHGHAIGTLAEDSGRWRLRLELPGHNLVGFEHSPASEQQRQDLNRVRALLASGEWLRPDPESGCRVDSSELATIGYSVAHTGDHEQHSQSGEHDHNHDHDDPNHHHADEAPEDHVAHGAFVVDAVISCDSSRRMRWLDIDLFEGFPDNHSIRVDVLSETEAASYRLAKEDFRIRFD